MEFSLVTVESFDEVMRHYTPTVYRIAFARLKNPTDCEDVTQNVFVRYFKANLTFESEEHRKAWLIRCAVNCANTYAASAWVRHRGETEDLENLAESLSDNVTEDAAERHELRLTVLDAVMKLPDKYRIPVHLFYFEDMSTAQIAKAVGIRESTVRSQLTRARKMLEKLLKGVEF